ncbi:hypothetical protein [Actinophytocola sediminis]
MNTELRPAELSWDEVDPRRHAFDPDAALAVISALEPAGRVPTRPAGHAGDSDVIRWSYNEGAAWTTAMTRAMVARYGRWVVGWRWAHDEGEIAGGPVGAWCCPRDSMTVPEETLARVAAALCDWRGWLVDLAEWFDRFPLTDLPAADREDAWERATVHLVTQVVDRTGSGDAWYTHCEQVLTWFLTRWEVPPDRARARIERAIGGRFQSWIQPDRELVRDVAERLAGALETDQA